MDCNDSDYVVDTSPVADEQPQPQPDPVMPEAAAQGSSPSSTLNDDDMLEYYHVLRHLHFHNRLSALMHISAVPHYNAFSHVMEEVVLDDIPTMLFVFGGVLVGDGGGYANGGFGAVPASGGAMADLPKTTVGEIKGEKAECAVCIEAYQVGDTVRTMPCSHDFHESCIFEWLRVSRLCPLCRFALPAVVHG